MDLNEMLVFVRVAEEKSFTRAAEKLGVPKSKVSRKVATLEERLGTRLLQRTTRTIRLTESGRAYFERCSRVISEAEEAESLVRSMQTVPRGVLKVTAPIEPGLVFISRIVDEFLKEYPEVSVDLHLSSERMDLIRDGYDLAIRLGQLEDSSTVARKLGSFRARLFASPEYLARRGIPQTPADLQGHDCILFSAPPEHDVWELTDGRKTTSIPVSGRVAVNHLMAVANSTIAGHGISLLSDMFLCENALTSGKLVPVLENWYSSEVPMYAAYPSRRFVTPKLKVFLEFLTERMKEIVPQGAAGC